jgi:hypothetical protein
MQSPSELNLDHLLILIFGYLLTFALSGLIVRLIIGPTRQNSRTSRSSEAPSCKKRPDLGTVIGKCENFLTITLILADQVTGLALIFTAKSILRAEDMKDNPRLFLGGTLVNLCFSMFMGFVIRGALGHFGFPGTKNPGNVWNLFW